MKFSPIIFQNLIYMEKISRKCNTETSIIVEEVFILCRYLFLEPSLISASSFIINWIVGGKRISCWETWYEKWWYNFTGEWRMYCHYNWGWRIIVVTFPINTMEINYVISCILYSFTHIIYHLLLFLAGAYVATHMWGQFSQRKWARFKCGYTGKFAHV